jgi:predicted enzyme related to lactoylglutathione lyase
MNVTHFEVFAEDPAKLAEFYRSALGWQIEKAPGIDYWRIRIDSTDAKPLGGGLMFRPIPGPRSWCTTSMSSRWMKP